MPSSDPKPILITRARKARWAAKRAAEQMAAAERKAPAEIDPEKLAKQAARASIKGAKRQLAKGNEKAQAKLEAVTKVIDVLAKKAPAIIQPEDLEVVPPNLRRWAKAQDVVFKPNPGPQEAFLAASEQEVFYGGARGGGKSYAMLVDPLRYCSNSNHRALILRRTMPELRDMIYKAQMLYPKAFAGTRWREQEKEFRFPSGARIEFGYAENMADAMRYQGQSYSWIGVDELPQFPSADIWNFLRSSLRSVDPSLPTFMRATGNPGNVGSFWVKEMFIDPAEPNTRFEVPIRIVKPGEGVIERTITRKYIPSTVFDNPYLTYDDNYIAVLASLPEVQRKQFLEGNWDAFDNAAFPEFDRKVHVVEPFEVPLEWVRWRACDCGYSSPACVLWFAADPDNNIWVYDELYTKGLTADRFARMVVERDAGAPMQSQVLDASVWAMRGDIGPSIAELMNQNGCRWRPSDRSPRSRKNGKVEIHRRLSLRDFGDGTQAPGLRVFANCRNLIRTIPLLPLDANDPEDVDTKAEDHAYDALRYGCMARQTNSLPLWDVSMAPGFTPADSRFGY